MASTSSWRISIASFAPHQQTYLCKDIPIFDRRVSTPILVYLLLMCYLLTPYVVIWLQNMSMSLNLRDKRVWKAFSMQFAVMVGFSLYTLLLYRLPTLWNGKTIFPTSSTNENPPDSLAIDVWFALALPAVCDAVATVATFNRSVIDHWHYFIGIRMTAFAAIVSVLVAMSGSESGTTPYAIQYPAASLLAACSLYLLIGAGLDTFHRPPPTISANTRFWTLQEYTISLSRTPGTWWSAILSTCVTGGLGTVLTMLVPRTWSTLIPIITTGFEVSHSTHDISGRLRLT